MRLLFCFLALFSVGSLSAQSWSVDQQTMSDLSLTLDQVESSLTELKTSLHESEKTSAKLSNDLTKVQTDLEKSVESLKNTEGQLADSQASLTKVSLALKDSEQSLADSRNWELVKLGIALGLGLLVGLLF